MYIAEFIAEKIGQILKVLLPVALIVSGAVLSNTVGRAGAVKAERERVAAIVPPAPTIKSLVAMKMCGKPQFIVVVRSDGEVRVLMDPSIEMIVLLDKVVPAEDHKLTITIPCDNTA